MSGGSVPTPMRPSGGRNRTGWGCGWGRHFVEHILTVVTTGRQQERSPPAYLTACCLALYAGAPPPFLLPQTSGSLGMLPLSAS